MVNLRAANPWHLVKQAQQVLAAQCILCFHQWICIGNEGCSSSHRVGDVERASHTHTQRAGERGQEQVWKFRAAKQ